MAYTKVRKYSYKFKMGEEPDFAVFDARRWTDLRRKLNELSKNEWLKIEIDGEDAKSAVETIRQACYNWSYSPHINLSDDNLRIQTLTAPSDNGDIEMWVRITDAVPKE